MSKTALRVPEMTCDMCRTAIEGALDGLPGVTSVTVDVETKLVTIEHNDSLAPISQLSAAIQDEGYDVTAHKAL